MTEFLTAPRPIRSVLIANRGEIACRIIATCRKLGLRSVAVHSEADTGAAHVLAADLALCIGPAPSRESYLDIDAVIGAARASGADAVHAGYGFLSENPEFVRACEDAGLIFIGPSARAVAAMGSKIEARRIADAAGVPVVPGVVLEPDDPAFAGQVAALGFPVLVKASAGGGGRGMRRVDHAGQLAGALASARTEAGAAFGDAMVFVEKLILSPRHLEVQVFGDGQGGAMHLYERDCSVQRNHQKLIEEAPAPDLPGTVRARLLAHALKLTRAIDYEGAGTVEFIMESGGDRPYFLEMNTRLQVEHPVTEAICGVDLVEWQLRQAAGLALVHGSAPLVETEDKTVPLSAPPPRIWHEGKVIHVAGRALSIAFECRPLAAALAQAELEQPGHGVVLAPLTGQVTAVHVRVGDQVSRGTELVVMEAMKLIHTLAAPIDGTVTRVACAPGQTLTAQTVLVEIDDGEEEES